MTKYELILQITKEAHNLALTRREGIRNRINLIAAFGFGIITLLTSSFFDKVNELTTNLKGEVVFLLIITSLVFLVFLISYLTAFGVKKIEDHDSEKLYDKLRNIVHEDEKMKIVFYNRFHYYTEIGVENPILLAESDAIYSYISNALAIQTNHIYDKSKKINDSFILMSIFMVLTIICLIIMRGVI